MHVDDEILNYYEAIRGWFAVETFQKSRLDGSFG